MRSELRLFRHSWVERMGWGQLASLSCLQLRVSQVRFNQPVQPLHPSGAPSMCQPLGLEVQGSSGGPGIQWRSLPIRSVFWEGRLCLVVAIQGDMTRLHGHGFLQNFEEKVLVLIPPLIFYETLGKSQPISWPQLLLLETELLNMYCWMTSVG